MKTWRRPTTKNEREGRHSLVFSILEERINIGKTTVGRYFVTGTLAFVTDTYYSSKSKVGRVSRIIVFSYFNLKRSGIETLLPPNDT